MIKPTTFSPAGGTRNSSDIVNLRSRSDHSTDSHFCDWLRLIRDSRWSLAQKLQLLGHFDDPSQLYKSSEQKLRQLVNGRAGVRIRSSVEADIDRDRQWLEIAGNTLISFNDLRYPSLLKEIHDPPLALFAMGDLTCLDDPKIAMVGSRRPTPVGSRVTDKLAGGLADLGIVVTSGMALGVDASAHQGALAAGSPTIAVMGCGMDTIYPSRHRALFAQIAESGCILSEYPLGLKPTRYSFPQRNRIVSGLSLGVVIVEAAERSGTLITARLAVEQNRQLMVVPGSVLSPHYAGSHRLMQQGAAVITTVDDILHALALPLSTAATQAKQSDFPKADEIPTKLIYKPLLEHIGYESTKVDDIILASGLTAAEVSSMLLILEVEGAVAVTGNGGYLRLY